LTNIQPEEKKMDELHSKNSNQSNCDLLQSQKRPKIFSSSFASHCFYVSKDKQLFGCGGNSFGQLGIGNFEGQDTLVPIPLHEQVFQKQKIAQIVCGLSFTLMLLSERKVVLGAGRNEKGQLGFGDTKNRNQFEMVPLDFEKIGLIK